MNYGTVVKLVPDRGFGFIRTDRGQDIYFHAKEVEDNRFDFIQIEQPVMFELVPRNPDAPVAEKPRAAKVKVLDRMPGGILPRPEQKIAPRHHPRALQRKPTWRTGGTGGASEAPSNPGDDSSSPE